MSPFPHLPGLSQLLKQRTLSKVMNDLHVAEFGHTLVFILLDPLSSCALSHFGFCRAELPCSLPSWLLLLSPLTDSPFSLDLPVPESGVCTREEMRAGIQPGCGHAGAYRNVLEVLLSVLILYFCMSKFTKYSTMVSFSFA